MSDHKTITDGFGTVTLIKPTYQCDIIDGRKGFTDFGYRNGAGYYLGEDTGVRNFYIDTDVENGRTYYYVLVSFDYGVHTEDVEVGPSENTYTIDINRDESINAVSRNVAIVKPHQLAAGYVPPQIKSLNYHDSFGKNTIQPEILVETLLKDGHEYKVDFGVDTITYWQFTDHGAVYRNVSINVYDQTAGNVLVYHEDPENFTGNNYQYYRDETQFWNVREGYEFVTNKELVSTAFDGLLLRYHVPALEAVFDSVNSGWMKGNTNIRITQPVDKNMRRFAYDYDIIFTENADYVGIIKDTRAISDEYTNLIRGGLLINYPLPFYAVNRSVTDSLGQPIHTELIVQDLNTNGQFDWLTDRILVGHLNTKGGVNRVDRWAGLSFIFDFLRVSSEQDLPQPGDSYHVTFVRGFTVNDSVTFRVEIPEAVDKSALKEEMEKIKVVPNPYVVTNTMEKAVGNWDKNQGRQIMFTHLPAKCTIQIFTITGLLVDKIEVDNSSLNRSSEWDTNSEANGTAHWDVLTKEGLEVAPGYYLYHVKSKITGDEKIGKFAIIK